MKVIKSDKPMTVEGSVQVINRTYWLDDKKPNITIGWKQIFSNPQITDWLAPIRQLPYGNAMDYTRGYISLAGTRNKNGTTRYRYQIIELVQQQGPLNPPSAWRDVPEIVADKITLTNRDGNSFTFWVQAEDPFGNEQKEFIYVRTDTSKPIIHETKFSENVAGPTNGYFSRYQFCHLNCNNEAL